MAYVTTLLAAVIAVIGTVVGSIYAQRTALRSRQQEFNLAKIQRQEEYELAQRRADLEQRRACYVALNIAIRRYGAAINSFLFALRKGDGGEGVRAELEESRRLYIERHAEAQMTVPGHVLEAAGVVRWCLGRWYAMAKRLESGDVRDDDSFDAAFDRGEQFWGYNGRLRSVMRSDLGIADADTEVERNIDSEVPRP
ncbi:hypothetical protein [Actinomadura sp. K4S16]|uniref:hypothetical protein n=1 Tax=Actinomadura sp. K4S16 TaxID=1316147 RepID=UPI0011EF146D|nr:hypothetical protein [Actinomadura sp. K4S16]